MASLLLVASVGFILGRSEFSVELDLHRTRVAVGDRAVGALQVQNKASRSSAPAMMELPVGHGAAQFRIPRLDSQEIHEDLFTIPTQRRQVLDVGPVRSVRQESLRDSAPPGEMDRQLRAVHPPAHHCLGRFLGRIIRDLEGMPTSGPVQLGMFPSTPCMNASQAMTAGISTGSLRREPVN